MNRTRPLATLAACSALAAVFAGSAIAGSEAETSVKVKKGPPAFHGKVKSDEDLCVPGRHVFIKKERRHGNKTLGATVADANGNWTIEIDPLKSAVYFAKVKKAIDVAPGISCVGAKSKEQVVD